MPYYKKVKKVKVLVFEMPIEDVEDIVQKDIDRLRTVEDVKITMVNSTRPSNFNNVNVSVVLYYTVLVEADAADGDL